jgi:hypothetical protein
MKNNLSAILTIRLFLAVITVFFIIGCGGKNQNNGSSYTKYLLLCTNTESLLLSTQDGQSMPYETLVNGNIKPFYHDKKCNHIPISLGNAGNTVQIKTAFSSSFNSYRINDDGSLSPVNP